MIDQHLIDTIVNEIYMRLRQCEEIAGKNKLLLIGSLTKEEEQILKAGYDLATYNTDCLSYECILISELPVERLGQLALGCSSHKEDQMILKALLEETPVYLLESGLTYRKYKKTAYKPLYTLYQDYEDKIKQYGVRIIQQVGDLLLDQKDNPEINYASPIHLVDKKLLLESDLMHKQIGAFSVIEVSKKCIITPLAEDFIRSHKLKIKRV